MRKKKVKMVDSISNLLKYILADKILLISSRQPQITKMLTDIIIPQSVSDRRTSEAENNPCDTLYKENKKKSAISIKVSETTSVPIMP